MIPLGELARFLERSAFELKFALDREVRLLMEGAAVEAKAMIGHYQPGWAELADSTKADRVRQGFSENDPLLRSGELRRSIDAEAESAGMFVKGEIGSNDPIAGYQEHGTSRIPPRPFLSTALMKVEPVAVKVLGELAVRATTPGKTL